MLLNSMYLGYDRRRSMYMNFLVLSFFKSEVHNIPILIFVIKQRLQTFSKKKNLFFNKISAVNSIISSKNSFFFKNVKVANFLHFKYISIYSYFFFYKNFFFTSILENSCSNLFFSLKSFFLNKRTNFIFLKKDVSLQDVNYNYSNLLGLFRSLRTTNPKLFLINNIFNRLSFFNSMSSFYALYKLFFFLPIYNVIKLSYSTSNFFFKNNFILQRRLANAHIFKYLNITDPRVLNINITLLKKVNILRERRIGRITRKLFSSILIRFSENIFKQSVCFIFDFNPYKNLTNYEWGMLEVFMRRLAKDRRTYWKLNTRILQNFVGFKRRFVRRGDVIYWKELISCCFICLKLRDATFFMNYLVKKSNKMSLYRHRFFFSRIFNIFKTMFYDLGPFYNLVGLKIQITGKISVTGNSRTRTMIFKHGKTNYSNLSCKCDSSFNIIRTNTGCLGVNLYIFYK